MAVEPAAQRVDALCLPQLNRVLSAMAPAQAPALVVGLSARVPAPVLPRVELSARVRQPEEKVLIGIPLLLLVLMGSRVKAAF